MRKAKADIRNALSAAEEHVMAAMVANRLKPEKWKAKTDPDGDETTIERRYKTLANAKNAATKLGEGLGLSRKRHAFGWSGILRPSRVSANVTVIPRESYPLRLVVRDPWFPTVYKKERVRVVRYHVLVRVSV